MDYDALLVRAYADASPITSQFASLGRANAAPAVRPMTSRRLISPSRSDAGRLGRFYTQTKTPPSICSYRASQARCGARARRPKDAIFGKTFIVGESACHSHGGRLVDSTHKASVRLMFFIRYGPAQNRRRAMPRSGTAMGSHCSISRARGAGVTMDAINRMPRARIPMSPNRPPRSKSRTEGSPNGVRSAAVLTSALKTSPLGWGSGCWC